VTTAKRHAYDEVLPTESVPCDIMTQHVAASGHAAGSRGTDTANRLIRRPDPNTGIPREEL